MSNPIGIIFASGFITFIERGGHFIQSYGFKTEIVDIIVSIIVYFSAFALLASEVIRRFHYNRQKKKEKQKTLEDNEATTSKESKI
jgi:simple sugar transport system permease protein